jgi:hypothetical protein
MRNDAILPPTLSSDRTGVKGSMPDVEGLEKLVDSFLDGLK